MPPRLPQTGLQVPEEQLPKQHSDEELQLPPIGMQLVPESSQMPPWHTPPGQQSESVVQVPEPIGMHAAPQLNPVGDWGSGVQMRLQHWSPMLQAAPVGKQAPPKFGKQRLTPVDVVRQLSLPPLQQFCDAP
jgi:hypothetical protein